MAAYAAVTSVMNIISQLQTHPSPPISLHNEQLKSLTQSFAYLQEYLESYPNGARSKDADGLESFIADTAYQVQDMIEAHLVDQIQVHREKIMSFDLYEGLQNMILEMEMLIKKKVIEITSMPSVSTTRLPYPTLQSTVVGFERVLIEVMDKLTRQQSGLQIVPIVGMGGIGKTTLATGVYTNPLIVHHFDFRAWATISQEYSVGKILLEFVLCLESKEDKGILSRMGEHELGDKLYKTLFGRRYLLVMDDVWSVEAWDKVKNFFPQNDDGSAIVITTRLSKVGFQLSGSCGLEMSFLDDGTSWELLCKVVFGDEGCPLELEETGKNIARNCKGLPLSIVVIGGLLAKSRQTRELWENIAEDLNSVVNLEDSERCLKTLRLSYDQLPVHLKPCFLYMGIFGEDQKIHVSALTKLWVAEGFLKTSDGKSWEVCAKEYLNDLIERNLILVHKLGSDGNIKLCTIHDLLRDLCIKEAEKDKFFRVMNTHSLEIGQSWQTQRRIGIHGTTPGGNEIPQAIKGVRSSSWTRSLICNVDGVVLGLPFRLLRVFSAIDEFKFVDPKKRNLYPLEDIFQLVNLRHLVIAAKLPQTRFPLSVYHLWNLQTLAVVHSENVVRYHCPSPLFDIWKMPQLRHVTITYFDLPDPPISHKVDGGEDDCVVLENLQTLSKVRCFKCGEDVLKRIPNINKLKIYYGMITESPRAYCLTNLRRLGKLESLSCSFLYFPQGPIRSELVHSLSYPHSLKKLSLEFTNLKWEDVATKIGPLPHLQVLKLNFESFLGTEWETVEGQFRSLKYLKINATYDLETWRTESHHFPCLEHLVLRDVYMMKDIPPEIADIPTLKLISLELCNHSIMISAQELVQEQDDLGNEGLQVRVRLFKENKEVERLASHNFIVELGY